MRTRLRKLTQAGGAVMADDGSDMTCQQFQATLPLLVESGENTAAHAHLQHCKRCSSLLADLLSIAEAARGLFPAEEPPEQVWEHIESTLGHNGGS
jgi:hypothetical protein